jgi:uncharacterized membrane protein YcaP (DUF421 family)
VDFYTIDYIISQRSTDSAVRTALVLVLVIAGVVLSIPKVGLTAEQLSRCLREENISSVADVDAAIMETNGKLTIRSRETRSDSPLLPLVSDGHLVEDGLRLSGKDTAWVEAKVKEQGYSSIKDVFLGQLCDGALEIVPFPRARIKAPMSGDM